MSGVVRILCSKDRGNSHDARKLDLVLPHLRQLAFDDAGRRPRLRALRQDVGEAGNPPPIDAAGGSRAPRLAPAMATVTGRATPGIVVALLLYFFFPAGLYLLWTHSVWTEKQKWKYTIIWLSAFGGLLLFSLVSCLIVGLATHAFQ